MDAGFLPPRDVPVHSLAKASCLQRALDLADRKLEPPRNVEEIIRGKGSSPGQQQGMRLPELPSHRGSLGELRRQIRPGM
jgi:hypothetical protein